MNARLDPHWQYHGLRAVVLENAVLRVVVMPETGGRIYSIVHKPTDTEFLWHNPRGVPRPVPFGASFDDNLVGGWDDLLPTVDACTFGGERIPDHGELWSLAWDWQPTPTTDGSVCLYTAVSAPITPIRFERWLTLDAVRPDVRIRYRLSNLAAYPLELIWGIHPMFAISPQHRLDLPAGAMLVDQASAAQLGTAGQEYTWPVLPTAAGDIDMRVILPAEAMVSGGHYATAPSEAWFALTDQAKQVGIAMVYPPDVFRALWLWMSYGGWRGHYHLAVEPWVGYPLALDQAVAAKRQYTLGALQSITYEVSVLAYTGLTQVSRVERHAEHVVALA